MGALLGGGTSWVSDDSVCGTVSLLEADMAGKGNPKTGGRRKGTPNKTSALLKDTVLQAAIAFHRTLQKPLLLTLSGRR